MPSSNVTITATFKESKNTSGEASGTVGEKITLPADIKVGDTVKITVSGSESAPLESGKWYRIKGGSIADGAVQCVGMVKLLLVTVTLLPLASVTVRESSA